MKHPFQTFFPEHRLQYSMQLEDEIGCLARGIDQMLGGSERETKLAFKSERLGFERGISEVSLGQIIEVMPNVRLHQRMSQENVKEWACQIGSNVAK